MEGPQELEEDEEDDDDDDSPHYRQANDRIRCMMEQTAAGDEERTRTPVENDLFKQDI